ncbi:hypothetical protein D9M71_542460 [compost metagenome]
MFAGVDEAMPGPGRHQQHVAAADVDPIGIAEAQHATATLDNEQMPPGMGVTVERHTGVQPLHGDRHPGRHCTAVNALVVSQGDNIHVAGLKGLTHTRQLSAFPHLGTLRSMMQALTKVLI